MTIAEFYSITGGDYREATSRLMNDALILRFIKKFPLDPSFASLEEALSRDATEEAFRHAHTLKGVAGNLAFARLASSASTVTEALRAGNLEEGKAAFPKLKEDYDAVIAALSEVA
ncbi:MAG: Hpt domain-containing protein [Bacilli bacterium]|nr:Hpt domain-containing protein [Bacilli bacterium]